ncbi:DNA-3-methyladenine glycosylase I [Actinomycetota bacterium]
MKRCNWVDPENKIYREYHDKEWGVPVHDDKKLFEMLILEGAQAGLSWEIVLKKRDNFKKAFDDFDPEKVARYNETKQNELLENKGIIRNRLKIKSAIQNAKVFLRIQNEFGSFDKYIWNFVNNKPIQNKFRSMMELPPKTELSDIISKDLKKRGMNFVGSTIIYAFMQAVGIVNDHEVSCFRYSQLKDYQDI